MEFHDTITIDAPVERVWALTVDVEQLPAIAPTISAVERLDTGPLAVGSRVRLRQPGLPARVWTVEELDEPNRFAWSTTLLGTRMLAVHELSRNDDGRCEQTLRLVLDGRGSTLLARLGGARLREALGAENAGFARAAAAATA